MNSSITLHMHTHTHTCRSPGPPLCSPSTSPCSPQQLLQAVQSHLHFSQIRSWQEVGAYDSIHSPFQLLYRLCSLDEGGNPRAEFISTCSGYGPVHHTFPLLPLTPHSSLPHNSTLLVSVTSLPRLQSIPHQLIPTMAAYPQAKTVTTVRNGQHSHSSSSEMLTSRPRNSSERLMVQKSSHGLHECFPFSPPLPSPLSPKLLSGLPDRLTIESSLATPSCNTDDYGTRDASSSCLKMLTNGLSSLKLEGEGSKSHAPSMVETTPRAPGSPAPFSSAYESNVLKKRRSCALTCKVCGTVCHTCTVCGTIPVIPVSL